MEPDGNNAVHGAFDAIGRIFTSDIPHWIHRGRRLVHRLPGMILQAIGNLGSLLVNAGRSLIDGLISGIKNAIPGLSSVLGWVTGADPVVEGASRQGQAAARPAAGRRSCRG